MGIHDGNTFCGATDLCNLTNFKLMQKLFIFGTLLVTHKLLKVDHK